MLDSDMLPSLKNAPNLTPDAFVACAQIGALAYCHQAPAIVIIAVLAPGFLYFGHKIIRAIKDKDDK
ncbi:MAG TPA: hypothetical protein VFB31_07830 [Pseudolabrys sp.]|nr:hypothetical protein [Pseudolabrys sp.]